MELLDKNRRMPQLLILIMLVSILCAKSVYAMDFFNSEVYADASKNELELENCQKRSLKDEAVSYYIPDIWCRKATSDFAGIETAIDSEYVEGYRYILNIAGTVRKAPELLYVFYLDKNRLEKPGDLKSPSMVEKAIIKNITPEVSIPLIGAIKHKYTTDKRRIDYFQTSYETTHLQYMFVTKEGGGMLTFVYIFEDEPYHEDEVAYVLNSVATDR